MDARCEIRDARFKSRIPNHVSRISILASRIPNFESRLSRTSCLSRSPSTNSDQDQLTVEKWISYICSTRLIHDVTPILGTRSLSDIAFVTR